MLSWRTLACLLLIAGTLAPAARAANETAPMMQYLGYTALWQEYGGSLANGSNVPVSIAETSDLGAYYPNAADGRFAGKTITPTSTFTAALGSSTHATGVGSRFFGNDTGFSTRSVAPAVQNIQAYSYSEFLGSFLLNPGTPAPNGSPNNSRVASHAYNLPSITYGNLARFDYLIQRDDFLQVVPNTGFGALGNSFNSIVVVSTNGTSAKTAAIGAGTPYTAGRVSPTITGPLSGSPSGAIGQVAGVVTLLVSRGKTTSSLTSYTTASTTAVTAPYSGSFSTYSKPGYTVNSGDTSEVVKAALMAGALRNVATYTNGVFTVSGITDYRVAAANQTANGLDYRWGAGMVNAYNSYKIIDAGEQGSAEDNASAGGGIGRYGFDYDPAFGGAGGSNATATYGFQANANGKLAATLAWNIKIAGGSSNFDDDATLYDLDLTLIDLTAGNAIVQTSASLIDNTETLWADLVAGHTYHMLITTKSPAFTWDYGLAWRSDIALTPVAVPEPASLALLAAGSLALARRRR